MEVLQYCQSHELLNLCMHFSIAFCTDYYFCSVFRSLSQANKFHKQQAIAIKFLFCIIVVNYSSVNYDIWLCNSIYQDWCCVQMNLLVFQSIQVMLSVCKSNMAELTKYLVLLMLSYFDSFNCSCAYALFYRLPIILKLRTSRSCFWIPNARTH